MPLVLRLPSVVYFVVYFLWIVFCEQGDEDQTCGTLFSGDNYKGDTLILHDLDQTVNIRRDYRASVSGWLNTSSIRVEDGCKLQTCSDVYFQGRCVSVKPGTVLSTGSISKIRSAKCVCSRECRCGDVAIAKHQFGRAYQVKGCSLCNAPYLLLSSSSLFVDHEFTYSTAFEIRSGCNLTVYTDHMYEGDRLTITSKVYEGYNRTLGSYKFDCEGSEFEHPQKILATSGVSQPLLQLPSTAEKLFQLVFLNESYTQHPGIQAGIKSLECGRSSRNAYILFIGLTDRSFSIGIEPCPDVGIKTITECHIVVSDKHLGISNSEIRVIYLNTNLQYSLSANNPINHYRVMASLDEYLTNHDELKYVIPNCVIIWHDIRDRDMAKKGSQFQQKLDILNFIRARVVDENYSNIIFMLDGLRWLRPQVSRYPLEKLEEFENVTNQDKTFPKPIVIIPTESYWSKQIMVNGFKKMANGEYAPHNFQRTLRNLCKNAGDDLGYVLFKGAFKLERELPKVTYKITGFLNDSMLSQYRKRKTVNLQQNVSQKSLRIKSIEDLRKSFNKTTSNNLTPSLLEISDNSFFKRMCSRHHWQPTNNISDAIKEEMYSFGFANGKGRKIYPCRGTVKNNVRFGAFTFNDRICRVFLGTVWKLDPSENVHVLTIPGSFTRTEKDENGTNFRFEYDLIGYHLLSRFIKESKAILLFSGINTVTDVNKIIAFASFSVANECEPLNMIGTKNMNETRRKQATFPGNGKPHHTNKFKALVCTITKLPVLPVKF